MTENGRRAPRGNMMRVLNLILKELISINAGIKKLNNESPELFEKQDSSQKFANKPREVRKG